jgi:hypothetical protein
MPSPMNSLTALCDSTNIELRLRMSSFVRIRVAPDPGDAQSRRIGVEMRETAQFSTRELRAHNSRLECHTKVAHQTASPSSCFGSCGYLRSTNPRHGELKMPVQNEHFPASTY